MPDPMAEIRASFFVECDELLEAMQDGLQAMEDGTDDAETIHVVFRAVHSIKGGAGAFGLEALVRFSHRYETVLDRVRSGDLGVEAGLLKHFFRAADHLSDLVRASRDEIKVPSGAGEAILAELNAHIGADVTPDEVEPEIEFQPTGLTLDLDVDLPPLNDPPRAPQFKICFTPDAEMFDTGNDVFPILRSVAALGACDIRCDTARVPALSDIVPETSYLSWTILLTSDVDEAEVASVFEFVEGLCKLRIERVAGSDTADAPPPPPLADEDVSRLPEPEADRPKIEQPPQRTAPAATKSVVRVDLDRIERLVNLVGELVINQAMLAQSLQSAGLSPHSNAMNGLEEFQRLTRDIQDSVMMIRAQPVKPLFQRMSRIVREASTAVNKDVRLITDGETTEVDKTVIERLADPLTHMIRNAVDHGLEPTHERLANGKAAQGHVTLSAAHRSGRVIIEVSDDGGGINRPRVLQVAMDKGLIPPDAVLSESEIDNLLFLPGFSTADTVSDLSGRGVGMDVVRTAIQSLGGRISITSTPDLGTTFSISLPLTLAVLDGMVIEVAGETLVLPLNVVAETVTLSASTLDAVQPGLDVVRVRGGLVPLFDLGYLLGYRARKDSYIDGVALLITHDDGSQGALVVDEIQDQRQVVIKGLDDTFYRAPGIAAATILGDGQIALILDPSDIIAQAGDPPHNRSQKTRMEA
ncbi:chemotaxis protein CheA [uncultured Tateyamaria sp.]|uniref:chemotaxis protein CheA n=1 Tax=uncultured Tateyamaria sp. TaxID=455651 RepID=UPI00261198B4|nr:chemotaxis protein CheA [uncultured Tateyamaria sp.]